MNNRAVQTQSVCEAAFRAGAESARITPGIFGDDMTIKFQGHVEKIGIGHLNKIELTLYGTSSVVRRNPIVLEVSKGEAEIYRPGMAVEFTIIPRPDIPAVEFETRLT